MIGPPRPKRRKCLYLMETKERGNWTWCILSSLPFLLWCALHLQEEVEPLKEHPVEAGEVEEVGEGEGGAEQGLRKVGRHLEVVKVVSFVNMAKKIEVAKVVKMSKTVLEDEPSSSMRELESS